MGYNIGSMGPVKDGKPSYQYVKSHGEDEAMIKLLSSTLLEIYKIAGIDKPKTFLPSCIAQKVYKGIEEKILTKIIKENKDAIS